MKLEHGWFIMQDVHDLGEACNVYAPDFDDKSTAAQFSEWEPLDYLSHLQPYFSNTPYYGRELRHFNIGPWWYKNLFTVDQPFNIAFLQFEGVDYFCKIWVNGIFAGAHEGTGVPFDCDVSGLIHAGDNLLVVKVWSPWDSRVMPGKEDKRVFHVVRSLFKGTYEHDDTLIQRDVNPVGIYGPVSLSLRNTLRLSPRPRILRASGDGMAQLEFDLLSTVEGEVEFEIVVFEQDSDRRMTARTFSRGLQKGVNSVQVEVKVEDIRLWESWERGEQPLYRFQITALQGERALDQTTVTTGFRDVELVRNQDETIFKLNGKRIFLRGSCYLPDYYLSEMSRERYRRDIENAKALGFNALRVHVHTARKEFYDLCDQYGILVIQDSDFNWVHDDSEAFASRAAGIFGEVVRFLQPHPSIIAWSCLNEPDFSRDSLRFVDGPPGPSLAEAVRQNDPSRPYILASFLPQQPESGDSHMYLGSLEDKVSLYTDIDHWPEKLNTEFGIDAPPCVESLRKDRRIWNRLKAVESEIDSVQYYQYRLIKYYIEHYRTGRFAPCSGYFQFMLIDLSPQSYYGIYDFWTVPRRCLDALVESNQPLAAMLKAGKDEIEVMAINDLLYSPGDVTVRCIVTGPHGEILHRSEGSHYLPADSKITVDRFSLDYRGRGVTALLTIEGADGLLARNRYDDFFYHPPRPKGHPRRMSHELGVRLFNA